MSRRFVKGSPYVVLDDKGFMQLYTDEGHPVKMNLKMRVTDAHDEIPTVIWIGVCNIVGTVDEMNESIEKNKPHDI